MAEFTDAQKIGSLHGKLMAMADQFEDPLSRLIRDDLDGVTDTLLLRGADGWGVRLTIGAERMPPAEVAAAEARVRQGRSA
jgi:hypothetical protein